MASSFGSTYGGIYKQYPSCKSNLQVLASLPGADVCGGYGGLQPGVFFFKFFFTPVIKPSPPLSPTTLNPQNPDSTHTVTLSDHPRREKAGMSVPA